MKKITLIAISLIASVSLFAQLECNNVSAEFTSDGNSYYFTSNRDGQQEIYRINVDGSGLTRITNNAVDEYYPRLHPDESKIVFQGGTGSASDIYTVNVDGTGLTQLTFNGRYNGCPTYHPNGQTILYHGWDASDYPEIFTMNADGSNPVQITNEAGAYWQSYARYNQDASKIYFRQGLNADNHIVMMDPDGSNWVDITPPNEFGYDDAFFSFSTDFSKITYYTSEWTGYGGSLEIAMINADGSNLQRLTTAASGENNISPSFNTQDNKIYFSSNREGQGYQIYSMDLDGNNAVRESDCGLVAVEELENKTVEFACQPNPILDQGNIELGINNPNEISIQFLDITGSKVNVEHSISIEGIQIRKGDLAAGLYFFNIHEAGKHVGYGKFLIQ